MRCLHILQVLLSISTLENHYCKNNVLSLSVTVSKPGEVIGRVTA